MTDLAAMPWAAAVGALLAPVVGDAAPAAAVDRVIAAVVDARVLGLGRADYRAAIRAALATSAALAALQPPPHPHSEPVVRAFLAAVDAGLAVAPARAPFPDARTLLDRHGLRAKKSFGQNFLVSDRVFRAIVDATVGADDDWIVEIGAGLGTLTARLAERVPEGKVIAVERDRDMVAVLRAELGTVDNVEIEPADAMRYDLSMAARWRGDRIVVCGNLPYNIASQILFRISDARAHVRRAVVMIQKEMADRILASPGGKDYGALGVMLQTYLDAKLVAKVPPGAFVPAPKVDSTVLRLTPLPGDGPRVPIADPAHYSAVVHAAFGQRRKTLRNALRAKWAEAAVDAALAATAIDGGRRGETLAIAELAAVAAALVPEPADA